MFFKGIFRLKSHVFVYLAFTFLYSNNIYATKCSTPKTKKFPMELFLNERVLFINVYKEGGLQLKGYNFTLEKNNVSIPLKLMEAISFPDNMSVYSFKISSDKLTSGVYNLIMKDSKGKIIPHNWHDKVGPRVTIKNQKISEKRDLVNIKHIESHFDLGLEFSAYLLMKTNLGSSVVKVNIKDSKNKMYQLYGNTNSNGDLKIGHDVCNGDILLEFNQEYSIQLQRVSPSGVFAETSEWKKFRTDEKKN